MPTEMASTEEVGSSKGMQPEGEPHGESLCFTLTNDDNIDYIFHAEFDMAIVMAALENFEHDPKSLKDAQSHSDWPCWKEAMDIEMAMLKKTKTWITVPQPPGKNIVHSKWVYCIKHRPEGQITKYKACLVTKGYTQIYGIDYYDTFSPVMWLASLCTILAYATHHDWEIESFDFNSTYLNGILTEDKEVYMQEPPTYETSGKGTYVKKL
jgi:hypothetical protein